MALGNTCRNGHPSSGRQVHHRAEVDGEWRHYCPTDFWYCTEWPVCHHWVIEDNVPGQCELWNKAEIPAWEVR